MGADRKCRDFNGCTALLYASRRTLLNSKYQDIVDCLEYADVYYEQKREWRNNKIVPTKTKKCLEFKSIVVTDVQGQKWTSQFGKPTTMMVFCILFFHLFRVVCCACFRDFSYRLCHCYSPPHPYVPWPWCTVTPPFADEISQVVMWQNASSGTVTYTRPTSADEVWMREQNIRDLKEKKERGEEAKNWVEKWDELSENPYW